MVAALDAQTNHTWEELMQMRYGRLLKLNVDLREHLNRRQEALDQGRRQ
jgi:hypothetical protein